MRVCCLRPSVLIPSNRSDDSNRAVNKFCGYFYTVGSFVCARCIVHRPPLRARAEDMHLCRRMFAARASRGEVLRERSYADANMCSVFDSDILNLILRIRLTLFRYECAPTLTWLHLPMQYFMLVFIVPTIELFRSSLWIIENIMQSMASLFTFRFEFDEANLLNFRPNFFRRSMPRFDRPTVLLKCWKTALGTNWMFSSEVKSFK